MIAKPDTVGTVGLTGGALAAEVAIFMVVFEVSGVWFCRLCEDVIINVDLRVGKVLSDEVGFGERNFVVVVSIRRLVVEVWSVVVVLRVVQVGRKLLRSFEIPTDFTVEVCFGFGTFEGVNGV